jgi:VanZ family protein
MKLVCRISKMFLMEGTSNNRNNKKLLWMLPASWMGVIFYFSNQPGKESAQMSGWFTKIVEAIAYVFNISSTEVDLHLLVRKGAHFTEFAILGFLLFIALYFTREKLLSSSIKASIIGVFYGVLDEIHQWFAPARSCQVTDMLIDAIGVLVAILLCNGYVFLRKPIRQKNNPYSA